VSRCGEVRSAVALLIATSADPDARTEGRTLATPLRWAASSDDAEALIDGGADIEAPGGSIGTLLDNAAGDGCWWHVARLLTARGARGTRLLLLPPLLYLLAHRLGKVRGRRDSARPDLASQAAPARPQYGR
jgi:hypothetical protein